MKLSKILVATSALLASISFFSCNSDDDSDAFSGKSVNYYNTWVVIDGDNVSDGANQTNGEKRVATAVENNSSADCNYTYRLLKNLQQNIMIQFVL